MADQIEEVKSKVDIVSIIGEHVTLKKAGSNFRGLCPFHQEKTPSFMVSPELQIFKCFGCQAGGDVFKFLELFENMDFPEALKYLADKVGVKLISFTPQDNTKQVLYELNNLATKFYNYLLTSHPIGKVALNYLKEDRQINDDSIKTFNIGYAPIGKNALSNFLIKKKKLKTQDIEKAGLVYVSHGRVFDRFQGRIVFPISDHRGNTIALAGRLLPPERKDVGKYINSPETPIYHKSYSLYGLNTTKDFIKKVGFAVVVEGEIDLISSWQTGIKNVVAIKGSAFTPDQARLLNRFAKVVVLALDSDFAGQNASRHGIKILQDAGFEIRVAVLGKFKDPDDAARGDSEFYKKAIQKAVPIWDFIIDTTVARFDPTTAIGKEKIGKEIAPVLADIENKIVQEHYIKKLAALLDTQTTAVSQEVEKASSPKSEPKEEQTPKQEIKPRQELLEERLIALILTHIPALLQNPKVSKLIKTPFVLRILEEFNNFTKTSKKVNLANFSKSLPKELLDRFSEIIFAISEIEEDEIKNEINQTFKQLSIFNIREKLVQLTKSDDSDKKEKSKELSKLSNDLKSFNSDEFERIIS